jgi:hypothetical protein
MAGQHKKTAQLLAALSAPFAQFLHLSAAEPKF